MTALEEIILETAKHLAGIGLDKPDPVLEQRWACALLQQRAAECRHLSGGLLTHALELASIRSQDTAEMARCMQRLSRDLTDRNHNLEKLAMDWATNPWPPEDLPAPKKLVLVKE